jgi:hypothetical protein
MTTSTDLRQFLRAHREELVLSLYLEARPADPAARHQRQVHLRQRIAATRERLAATPRDEQELFERLVQEALDRLPSDAASESGGSWACFVAASGRVLELTMPPGVETTVFWGLGANVVPYVRVAEPEAALIAQVDREHVRLTRWDSGRFETLLALEALPVEDTGTHMGEAPRVGFHSGTRGRSGADDAQCQRREESERLLNALVHKLNAVPGPELPVVVGGSSESVARLLKAVPASLAERSGHAEALRMELPQDAIPAIRGTLHELQARRLGQRLEALRDAAHANGLATTGLARTSKAAAHGAIAELIFSDQAWQAHPQEVETLIQRALMDGAVIAWAGPRAGRFGLDGEADGLVAGLRFAVSGP